MYEEHYLGVDPFWNRQAELAEIKAAVKRGGFGYVTGRRRVGKTALLRQACEKLHGIYYQAIEGTVPQQLADLSLELQTALPIFREITPKDWGEFFRLLSREKLPPLLVFDEFPYWVQSDSRLPSVFQKWIDHELTKHKTLLLISGSSQSMLHSQLLRDNAPLYGRASRYWDLEPLSYEWFCRALHYPLHEPESFERYCLVGGVPHYWKLMPRKSMLQQAETLYFEPSAILSEEPRHLLQDEGISGTFPKAILDLIGRGVSKPSEFAARMGEVQGNLSRPIAVLLDLGLIHRELPFGESSRTTKRVHYSIHDAALAFYYGVYLPNRGRWNGFSLREKQATIRQHISRQWEIYCRQQFPGAARYWERKVEIDLVAREPNTGKHLVAECKWALLSQTQEKSILEDLKARFAQTKLKRRLKQVRFRVFSKASLAESRRASLKSQRLQK